MRLFEGILTAPESVASRGRDNEIFVSLDSGSIVKVYGANYDQYKEVTKIGSGCGELLMSCCIHTSNFVFCFVNMCKILQFWQIALHCA